MALILSPTDAALLIGAKCGTSAPDSDDEALVGILTGLTSRLAAAMNVDSLEEGTHLDRFYLDTPGPMPVRGPRIVQVRLSNGYVDPTSFVLRDEDGEIVTDTDVVPTEEQTDSIYGVVDFSCWQRGYYSLQYTSGFALPPDAPPEDAEVQVLVGTPEWMKHVVVSFLVIWYRTVRLAPRMPKGAAMDNLMEPLYRELQSRVYESYQRPRTGLVWVQRRY